MQSKSSSHPNEREWNFDPVPDDEIELCFLYEYGRSSESLKKLVHTWRIGHRDIVVAANKLLKRKGAFAGTVGPTPASRETAYFFAESGKAPTKAEKRKADENAKAWVEWIKLSWQGGHPGQLRLDDPRVFLFYFPPFPKTPWQNIAADMRKRAFRLLSPGIDFSGRLHLWLLLANKDFTEQIKAQQRIQAIAGKPLSKDELQAQVRRQLEQHILAPALIEKSEGMKRDIVGTVPPGFSWGKTQNQVCVGGYCREEVTFVVNWAESDKAIKKALGEWLKHHRPHKEFRTQNSTTAREHLEKLGAWRILNEMTAEQATACNLGLYRGADDYLRAKAEADDLLKRLF
ncbi:MAG: hypothetical protein HY735_37105 [Verrucomicrobia bacterium]|nr:hypothetical protein [Verrucomicrobiota bacterium]